MRLPRALTNVIRWTIPLMLAGTAAAWAGMADADAVEERERAAREKFLVAERALELGLRTQFTRLLDELQDYPLYPYLLHADLLRRLDRADPAEVGRFLVQHADTPLADRLRHRWLTSLAQRERWATFLAAYRPSADVTLQCHHLRALLATGQAEYALPQVEPLWLVGHSQPGACDRVFGAWREAGELTAELAWARIRLAMRAGEVGLAGYLARFLPEEEQVWVERWRRVHREPASTVAQLPSDAHHPVAAWIALHGIKRLARNQPAAAAEAWQQLSARYTFDERERDEVRRTVALAFARHGTGPSEQATAFAASHGDKRVWERQAISALADQDWVLAVAAMEHLPAEDQESERWVYWRARALGALGYQDQAEALSSRIAGNRSYYGFLAADLNGAAYRVDGRPLATGGDQRAAVEALPGVARARELFVLERLPDARREWSHLLERLDTEQLHHAARLAHEWGWHDRVIVTLGRARAWDDLEMRFPLAHRDRVVHHATEQGIDPAWAFAVIRQESAFTPDARSHAGAMGLMQLLPSTARSVAKALNMRLSHTRDLLDADTNIRLGVTYLSRSQQRFQGHSVLATAAYNAGQHRVRRWLPDDRDLPADVWVEMVPFGETRDYLQRILTYTAIYERRLGRDPTPLRERMPAVPGTSVRTAEGEHRDGHPG